MSLLKKGYTVKKKLINIDFDGPLYDLQSVQNEFLLQETGVLVKPEDVQTWDYYIDNHPRIFEVWSNFEHYSKGSLIQGARKFFDDLMKIPGITIDDVCILTHTRGDMDDKKDELIRRLLPDHKVDIYHVHAKDKQDIVGTNFIVDDYDDTIKRCSENGATCSLFDGNIYHYSEKGIENSLNNVTRAMSHDDVIHSIEGFLKAKGIK